MIIDLPDDPSKFELSSDNNWGNYHFFYTIEQTLLSNVYTMFRDAFCINIIGYIMRYIIWAYMDDVRSIFSQKWGNEMV